MRLIAVHLLAACCMLCMMCGCAMYDSQRFEGTIAGGHHRPSFARVTGGFFGESVVHPKTEVIGVDLSGAGILIVFNDHAEAGHSFDSRLPTKLDAYIIPVGFARDSDMNKFINTEPTTRAEFTGAYALHGTIAAIRWRGPGDFRIWIDACTDDPKSTRIKGTLRSCMGYIWGLQYGFGPL